MGRYLTPSQYLRSADGMTSASSLSAEVIDSFIQRACADIDGFMGFDPQTGGGFEPHTIWYQEAWNQKTLKTRVPTGPVPVRSVSRYRIQVSNASGSGAGFFANINSADVTFNVYGGYIEIVPLQAITYAMTPVLVELGMNPPVVQVDLNVGYYLPAWGDTLYDSGDHLTFRSLRGFWATSYSVAPSIVPNQPPAVPPVVYVNGVIQSGGYTVNYVEGGVTFAAPQAGAAVTADYAYQIPDLVKAATIAQTSYLIGNFDLNQAGMSGVMMARNDHQEIRRAANYRDGGYGGLCVSAKQLLDQIVEIPIA